MNRSTKDYIKYLDPRVVSKLKTLELKAKFVVEGFMVGHHKSPYHGFSAEFREHRPYNQGDPFRNIDWKVYAKSERFYIKQFEDETNLISHIILDNSGSMSFKRAGSITKLDYGKILAASFGYILNGQQDSVGLALFSDKLDVYLPPKSNRIYLKEIFSRINSAQARDKTFTEKCLVDVASKIKKRGLVIVISDFFDEIDSIVTALKNFRYKKNEVIVFHVLDPSEVNFSFERDSVFVDLETKEEIQTSPSQIQKAYQEAMHEFITRLRSECVEHGIDYNLVTTDEAFDKALFSFFRKRARMR